MFENLPYLSRVMILPNQTIALFRSIKGKSIKSAIRLGLCIKFDPPKMDPHLRFLLGAPKTWTWTVRIFCLVSQTQGEICWANGLSILLIHLRCENVSA